MNMTKDEIIDQMDQVAVAEDIAVAAKVLTRCEWHGHHTYLADLDYRQAYILANRRYSRGDLQSLFSSRKEMTDLIKMLIEDAPLECPRCAEMCRAH